MQTRPIKIQNIGGIGLTGEGDSTLTFKIFKKLFTENALDAAIDDFFDASYSRIKQALLYTCGIDQPEQTFIQSRLERLLEHIHMIIHYGLRRHHDLLPKVESEYELITRVTMSEFSFYTREKPLSLKEYEQLIIAVNEMVSNLPPNLHFVLATFPVVWSDDVLHNVGLHVQSPRNEKKSPILHHFDKKIYSVSDLVYHATKNTIYPLYHYSKDYYKTKHSPKIVLKHCPITTTNQYRGAIRIKTQSGQSMLVAIEICLENKEHIGLNDTATLINKLNRKKKTVPAYSSHVLSSNIIPATQAYLIGPLIHADREYLLPAQEKEKIEHPPFGKSLEFHVYPPQLVTPMNQAVKNRLIEYDNKHAKTPSLHRLFTPIEKPKENHAMSNSHDKIDSIANDNLKRTRTIYSGAI